MNLGPLAITDPQVAPTYGGGPLSRWCQTNLHDARDEVFVRLTLKGLARQIGLMVALWFGIHHAPVPAWIPMAIYMGLWGWLTPPMILMLHCTMHRPFTKMRALDKL